jgi:hypothetical protein
VLTVAELFVAKRRNPLNALRLLLSAFFLFAAIHGAHPAGQRFALFNNIPDVVVFAAMFTKRQDSRFAQRKLPKANIMDDVSEKYSRYFCIRCHPWRSP